MTVVVGVDFSRGSKAALAHARHLGEREDVPVRVLHVIESAVVSELAAVMSADPAAIANDLIGQSQRDLRKLCDDAGLPATTLVDASVGAPAEVILAAARDPTTRLVLGATGPNHVGVGAGTTASQCVRQCHVPILLVRPDSDVACRRVMAPVDFSSASHHAARYAARMAALHDATLKIVHVYYGPWHQLHYRAPSTRVTPDFRNQYVRGLEAELHEFGRSASDGEVETALIECSSVGDGILRQAQQWPADLVVIGKHGRSGLKAFLLGSTSEKVIRKLNCNIWVVPE